MKKIIILLFLISISFNTKSQITGILRGGWNVCIGRNAGWYLTTESFCTIIGHDSTAINLKGKDLLWYVDYKESLLTNDMISLLKNYEPLVGTKEDTRENRISLHKKLAYLLHKYN
ncbi:MAG: hypothetical protein ABIP51_15955 [Bacteroidia bacterium]